MLLRSTLTSPFGRKVLIAASYLGLDQAIAIVKADTLDPNDPLRSDNPLGKMPVLILDDGRKIYDSPVILEHLDHLAGGNRIIPQNWDERLECLTLQALSDGMLDAALLILYERRRPDAFQYESWINRQVQKIERGLAALEGANLDHQKVNAGTITVACLLSYLDRRRQVDWRTKNAKLIKWLDAFRSVTPLFESTEN